MGAGILVGYPGEEPGESGSADADRWAALWRLEDTVYGAGVLGLEGLVTGDLVDHAAPHELQYRDAGHLGALLTVADLPPDFRAA